MLLKKIIGKRLKKNTQKIAFSGIMAGMCVAVIFVGSLLELIDLSTAGLCGIIILISLYKTDVKYSVGIYIAASVLSFILVSQKTAPVFFALIFGPYPFIWYYTLKIKKVIVSYIVKLALFNTLAFLSIMIVKELIASYIDEPLIVLIALAFLGNIVFLLFDYLLSILWFNMTGCFYGIIIPFAGFRNKK